MFEEEEDSNRFKRRGGHLTTTKSDHPATSRIGNRTEQGKLINGVIRFSYTNLLTDFCKIITQKYPLFTENCMYSEPPKTGLSGIRMVIFRTLFVSGFRMLLAAILLKTIRKPDFFVRFVTSCPVFEWWDHLKTGPDIFDY
jgi:hypothetical protein